jgi:hypothetical protein
MDNGIIQAQRETAKAFSALAVLVSLFILSIVQKQLA